MATSSVDAETQKKILQKVAEGGVPTVVLLGIAWFLSGEMDKLSIEVASLREQVVVMQVAQAGDRWTASDHRDYAREVEARLRDLDARVTHLEAKDR